MGLSLLAVSTCFSSCSRPVTASLLDAARPDIPERTTCHEVLGPALGIDVGGRCETETRITSQRCA